MRITLTSKRNGILKKQINIIEKELNRLMDIYKDVKIDELAGFEDDTNVEGMYYSDTKTIKVNRNKCRSLLNEKEYIETRRRLRGRIDKRRKIGLKAQGYTSWNDYMWSELRGLKSLIRHEFGHAIFDQMRLSSCADIIMLYHTLLTEDEIQEELGDYATKNMDEFVAVAFEESFYSDCSNLAKRVRKIIDKKAGIIDE